MLLPAGMAGIAAAYADEQDIRDRYWHPRRGDTVIDIGAGVGIYTLPALQAGATVVAVDPDTAATSKLRLIAEMNSLTAGLAVVSYGIFDEDAYPAPMYAALASSEWSSLIPQPGTPFVTLDWLAEDLCRLDWVKIDVEGAELGVLRSGRETLQRFHPHLIVELHDEVYPYVAQMGSARLCRELLSGLGYEPLTVPYGPPPRSYLIC